ncbi:MAG: CoA transferase [Burkholderiales bacterium]
MSVLNGVRVLDLTRVLAGPLTGQILADMGCDVVKIERPGTGDDTRGWVPPFARDSDGGSTDVSAYFLSANRGKRSVTVDLDHADGCALVQRLATHADVLVENYRVGDLARRGLDHASLSALNPRLVYCSITGYGQTGPYAERPGYDPIAQAFGGLMSITGVPAGEPVRCGVSIVDILTGIYGAVAVAGALFGRASTGLGQHVDLALLDVQVASLVNVAQAYLSSGVTPARMGSAHPSVVPSQVFPASDGYLMLTAGNDGQFDRLCDVLDRRDLAQDERFATNRQRVRHRDALIAILSEVLVTRSRAAWVEACTAVGVPCAPINSVAEAFDDPQVRHREMTFGMPDPALGMVTLLASPLRFSATPVEYRRPPPRLGEHTAEVLHDWLGLDAAAVATLRGAGAL